MNDELKKILSRELDELKQNKIRAGVLGVCFIVLLIFWITDDGSGNEEIILTDEPPLTKDLPVKKLPVAVEKSPDGVTTVLGANADALFIANPFAVEEKPKPPAEVQLEIRNEELGIIIPHSPFPIPHSTLEKPPLEEIAEPEEEIVLTGTAISGNVKTAMFLRGEETLFKTVGEEIGGRIISEITPDFVTFADGTRMQLGIWKEE